MLETNDRELVKKVNSLTRQSPFFTQFNQLKYKSPKGYLEYETATFQLARLLTCCQFIPPAQIEQDFSQTISLIILNQAYQQGFGAYWLAENLFDAFNNTKLPTQLGEIKRVVPCGLLFFPPKLKNPDGQALKWILFSHHLAGEEFLPIQLSNSKLQVATPQENHLAWFTVLDDKTQYAISRELKLEAGNLSYDSDNFYINETLEYEDKNIATQTEKEFCDRVTELLIQVLLYLQLKPYIGEPVPTASVPRRSQQVSKKQKLAPKMIGSDYQVKSERIQSSSGGTGSRKSPITHWRRGFYKWQPIGSRQESQRKHKLIWVEPVLVNG